MAFTPLLGHRSAPGGTYRPLGWHFSPKFQLTNVSGSLPVQLYPMPPPPIYWVSETSTQISWNLPHPSDGKAAVMM